MKRAMSKRFWIYGLMLLAMAIFLSGCAGTQPVEADRDMGQEVVKQVENEMGVFDDPGRTEYLTALGQRLVRTLGDRRFVYTFQIVDQPESNAFAAPGGYIFVSRGLFALTNNEDELANVVGHEITHVSQRHTAKQMAKARAPSLLALPGAVVGSVVSESVGNIINAPVMTLGAAYMAKHSRSDEFEADRLGQRLSAQSGYDPVALATILARLEKEAELRTGQKRRPGFFDTHPTTPDRVRQIQTDAQKIQWSPQPGITRNAAEYLRKLDRLLVGEDPAKGVFQGRKFLQPELNFAIEFPSGWMAANTPQAVAAFTAKKDAVVFLNIAGRGTDPAKAGELLARAMYEKNRVRPTRSEPIKIGKLPAHLVIYTDKSGREPMHLFFLFMAYRQLIYQFAGIAPEPYRTTIRETALSFRPLTSQERSSIRETRLRIVSARSNESLAQLSKRTGNLWDNKTTGVVNGIDASQPLKKGQLIKIAVSQPYKGFGSK
jgi:predicted Zn-dependent protease